MNYQDDPNDPDWKLTKVKTEQGTVKDHPIASVSKPKYSQKFCEKWLNVFSPWLTRCEDDPHKPFCRACQCRLDCNRCHLQRHERTTKHARNLEILVNKGEGAARQNLSIRTERSKYYIQRKRAESVDSQDDPETGGMEDYIEEGEQLVDYGYEQTDIVSEYNQEDSNAEMISDEAVEQIVESHATPTPHKSSVGRSRKVIKHESLEQPVEEESNLEESILPDRSDGMKLFMQIQKDKTELLDSFKEFMGSGGGGGVTQPSPPREKNHVDLFFESVSSSVKALSPKLVAEAKMRVSQLICELELRALNEEDASSNHHHQQQLTSTALLVSPEGSASGSYIMNQTTGMANAMQHHEDVQQYEALS